MFSSNLKQVSLSMNVSGGHCKSKVRVFVHAIIAYLLIHVQLMLIISMLEHAIELAWNWIV